MTQSGGASPATTSRVLWPRWKNLLTHPLFGGLLLALPVVFVLAPVPIDETRYLAVAWEMLHGGSVLVPHLNGAWYADKPPLLFWLIDLGWLVTGVHAWSARLVAVLWSGVCLLMLGRLTLRLGGSQAAARASMWLLLGSIYFAIFANAIMFDVLLTACVLLALHGVLDLESGRLRRGIAVTGIAIGLGILAKGPVMLLDFGFAAIGALWWSERLDGWRWRYMGALALAVLVGIGFALAWAIPAALHGGDDYARAIFLHQTLDRVAESFAHRRPIWWYFAALPLMLLPWPLVVRGRWRTLREIGRERATRFALAWIGPTFVVFCLISGKQPHYLLPLLPGVALLLAVAFDRGDLRFRPGLYVLAMVLLGVALVAAPYLVKGQGEWSSLTNLSPAWGALIAALAAATWFLRRVGGPALPALAMLALVLLCKLAFVQATGDRYDMRKAGAMVRAIQDSGQPLVHIGWHHGVYEFAGRLAQPLSTINLDQLGTWTHAHPDGLVMSFGSRFRFAAPPIFEQPFRSTRIGIWKARDALASGIAPRDKDAKDDPDSLPSDDD
ncbi:MAG: glycosyltransferase family 39 protein [Rhodanobacteraceae bacterium]